MIASRFVLPALVALAACGAARAATTVEQKGDVLVVVGDDGPNGIAISTQGTPSQVDVILDGFPFGGFIGIRSIELTMKDGSDNIVLGPFHISGDVTLNAGAGDDELDLDPIAVLLVFPTFIGGDVDVVMGGQAADEVRITGSEGNGLVVGGDVSIRGAGLVDVRGVGAGFGIQPGDVVIGGDLGVDSVAIALGVEILLNDVNVDGRTSLATGAGLDVVRIEECHFAGKTTILMGGGNDELQLEVALAGPSEWNGKLIAKGGDGNDVLDQQLSNLFGKVPQFTGFEVVK